MTVIMVGDGINDAPALSRAAVGVTLEGGTDLARELADVTILGGDLTRLPWLIRLSRATLRVARWNLFWAFFYNLAGVGLAVSGRSASALRRSRHDRLQPGRGPQFAAPGPHSSPGERGFGMNELWVAAALTFAASAHCLGMCGGLMVTVAARGKRPGALRDFLLLQLGKGTTYAFLGALAGLFGAAVTGSAAFVWSARILTIVAALALASAGLMLLGLRGGTGSAWGERSRAFVEPALRAPSSGAARGLPPGDRPRHGLLPLPPRVRRARRRRGHLQPRPGRADPRGRRPRLDPRARPRLGGHELRGPRRNAPPGEA